MILDWNWIFGRGGELPIYQSTYFEQISIFRDVSAVLLPGKFLPVRKFTVNCINFFLLVNYFLPKKMLCSHSNQMQSKLPNPNCKEIYF